MQTRRIAPRQNASARWRAHWASGIGIRKPHTLTAKPIDVGGFVIFAARTAQIRPAHVVNQDEQKIQRPGRGCAQRWYQRQRRCEGELPYQIAPGRGESMLGHSTILYVTTLYVTTCALREGGPQQPRAEYPE